MVILDRKFIKRGIIFAVLCGVIGIAMVIRSVLIQVPIFDNYFNAMFIGGAFGGFFSFPYLIMLLNKYGKYFDENREVTITQIASELEISEKKVIKQLRNFADRADRKVIKSAETIKFTS